MYHITRIEKDVMTELGCKIVLKSIFPSHVIPMVKNTVKSHKIPLRLLVTSVLFMPQLFYFLPTVILGHEMTNRPSKHSAIEASQGIYTIKPLNIKQ